MTSSGRHEGDRQIRTAARYREATQHTFELWDWLAMIYPHDWSSEVLKFWFAETASDSWFTKHPAFDETIRARFLTLHEALASCEAQTL